MALKKEPDFYLGNQPYNLRFVGVAQGTKEKKEVRPEDINNEKQFDAFAKVFGYHDHDHAIDHTPDQEKHKKSSNKGKKLSSGIENSLENTF